MSPGGWFTWSASVLHLVKGISSGASLQCCILWSLPFFQGPKELRSEMRERRDWALVSTGVAEGLRVGLKEFCILGLI